MSLKPSAQSIEIAEIYFTHVVSQVDLAKQFGLSRQRIHQIIRLAKRRGQGGPDRPRGPGTSEKTGV